MKYKIYKLDKNLSSYRWWRNYDSSHRNLPDVDIEKYLSYLGFNWVELTNTKGEAIKYESISRDSFDSIELYLPKLDELPDYIKVEYELAEGKKESLYYFLEATPTLYNVVNNLNSKVMYTLDKAIGFHKFHQYLIERNPQMFFVQKHYDRALKSGDKYYFDINKQPWYKTNDNNNNYELLVQENKVIDSDSLVNETITTFNDSIIEWGKNYKYEYDLDTKLLNYYNGQSFSNEWNLYAYNPTESPSELLTPEKIKFTDSNFLHRGMYEYIIVKPITLKVKDGDDKPSNNELWIFPISPFSNDYKSFGYNNRIDFLFEKFPTLFNKDNIICRFISYISPVAMFVLYKTEKTANYDPSSNTSLRCLAWSDAGGWKYNCNFFSINFLPHSINFKTIETSFINQLKKWYTNFNGINIFKTKENNPHLLAPQNFKLSYYNSTNYESKIDTSYVDILYSDTLFLKYDTFFGGDWNSRLLINKWNNNKVLTQTSNELTIPDNRNIPLLNSAWENNYLQSQILDTGRNNTIKSSAVGLTTGAISLILGTLLTMSGVGAGLGALGIAGGVGGIASGGVNLKNGLAQNELQKKILEQTGNVLNISNGCSGSAIYNTWTETKPLSIYTLGLSEQDSNVMNAYDNMFGYPIKSWLPYNSFDVCWDGNYMLCDLSKNYNSVFNILKDLDSIWTKGDNYINQYINALNNGITWFRDGAYIDLATDIMNFEKSRVLDDKFVTKPASVSRYLPFNEQIVSYDITALINGTHRDLNISHYSISDIPDSCNAYLELTENAVMVHINRKGTMRVQDIAIHVNYKLITERYWTLTSNDTIGWKVTDPKGTYNVHASTGSYNDIVSAGVYYNGEIDRDISHYSVNPILPKKEIGAIFVFNGSDVRLYAGSQFVGHNYSTKVEYNYNGFNLTSGDIVLRVTR